MEDLNRQKNSSSSARIEDKTHRPTANFPPSYWGDFFISYSSSSSSPLSMLQNDKTRIEELKRKVKMMFKTINDLDSTLRLIDDIQRLGLAYHFEEEIDESLTRIQKEDEETDNILIVALRLQLLRQQGHNISSDVFDKFKDEDGKFKQELSCKPERLLYLYEASWLGTQEEKILDEAMEFARDHMERLVTRADKVVAAKMKRALEMPYHRGMRRIEARHYIENIYKKDESNSHILFELAKLDFNYLQSLHQAEIKEISIWWREWGLAEKLDFFRDRVVEMYFWALGGNFKPQNSRGRLVFAKLVATMPPMDDMFDAYGTLEELQLFNDVIQRWDFEDTNILPEYMRVLLKFFQSVIKEIEDELLRKGRLHHVHYIRESIKAWVQGYITEAKWANIRYIPTLEEYLTASVITCGHPLLICATSILMGEEELTADVLDWVLRVPKIVKASSIISRLMDDISTTQFEQERKHVASSVQCYMNEHGVKEQEARAKLNEMVAEAWKDINEEFLNSCSFKKQIDEITLDYTRIMELLYKNEIGFTDCSGKIKDQIASLLVHPIQD